MLIDVNTININFESFSINNVFSKIICKILIENWLEKNKNIFKQICKLLNKI